MHHREGEKRPGIKFVADSLVMELMLFSFFNEAVRVFFFVLVMLRFVFMCDGYKLENIFFDVSIILMKFEKSLYALIQS